jgi:predicted GNAT family N-acyltransferase
MGLYTKFGFIAEGPQFEEAGIQHFKMVLKG